MLFRFVSAPSLRYRYRLVTLAASDNQRQWGEHPRWNKGFDGLVPGGSKANSSGIICNLLSESARNLCGFPMRLRTADGARLGRRRPAAATPQTPGAFEPPDARRLVFDTAAVWFIGKLFS